MQKSIIERVFPKPKRPLLPQYDEQAGASSYHDEDEFSSSRTSTPGRIRLDSIVSSSRGSQKSTGSRNQSRSQSQLQAAPLSASVVHHDDPFLGVDRAAATLQRTIQSLLDFQSQALSGRHAESEQSDTRSQRSATSTQTRSESPTQSRLVVPKRQPQKKKTTLRGARNGLVKSMQEFASLKDQELKITEDERAHRRMALDKLTDLETKKEAVQHEIQNLERRANGTESESLRSEARSVEEEIHELESRLMELKARHRHLTDRATQLENTAASELSSYQGTLSAIDREARNFLRRPPVKQSLGPRSLGSGREAGQDMYALRSERRTLDLAKEQWTHELGVLETHRSEVEREKDALFEGAKLWQDVIQKIDDFELGLREKLKSGSGNSTFDILDSMDRTIQFLQSALAGAESKEWNLLVCAIGAELEAFRQARMLLAPDEPIPNFIEDPVQTNGSAAHVDEDSDVPHDDLLGEHSPELKFVPLDDHNPDSSLIGHYQDRSSLASSNESLKATLKDLPRPSPNVRPALSASISSKQRVDTSRDLNSSASKARSKSPPAATRRPTTSSSEDDDPGPDFLLSHS